MRHFYDKIYNINFYVSHSQDEKYARRLINKLFKEDLAKGMEGVVAFTASLESKHIGGNGILFRFNSFPVSLGTIVHESFHAVVMLSKKVSMPIHDKNDEAFAYYQDWLVTKLCRILKGKVKYE